MNLKHKKTIFSLALTASMALGGPLPLVLAQEATPSPALRERLQERRQEFREKVQEKRQDVRERLQEKRQDVSQETREKRKEERQKQLDERKRERIRNFFEKMGKRLEAAIERLEKMASKIESRIQKFEAEGKDMSASKAKLALARAEIQEAKDAWIAAQGQFESALNAADFKEAFKTVRETIVKGVRDKIKEAHAALVDVINSMRGLSGRVKPSPSPSPTP